MSDLVGNPEDRFSHNEAHIVVIQTQFSSVRQALDRHSEIDHEISADWKWGRQVVQLSVLAEKMYCTICNTRLHFADIVDETLQGLGSLLTIKCTNTA